MNGDRTEYRVIMRGMGVLAVLGLLCSVWPVLDIVLTVLVLGSAGAAFAGYWLREGMRELLFRREMRALDARPPLRPEVRR